MAEGVIGYYEGDENFAAGNYNYYYLEDSDFIFWNGTTFIVAEGMGQEPAYYVSWFGAQAFANYYGLRVPLFDERIIAEDSGLINSNLTQGSYYQEWINDIFIDPDYDDGVLWINNIRYNGCFVYDSSNIDYGSARVLFRCVGN